MSHDDTWMSQPSLFASSPLLLTGRLVPPPSLFTSRPSLISGIVFRRKNIVFRRKNKSHQPEAQTVSFPWAHARSRTLTHSHALSRDTRDWTHDIHERGE